MTSGASGPAGATASITVAIPAYNEERTIEPMVRGSLEALARATRGAHEVIVINDGSRDRTASIVRGIAATQHSVRLIENSINTGFAEVQHRCYREAANDWVFLIPADGQIDPAVLTLFVPRCNDSDLILGVAQSEAERGVRQRQSDGYHWVVRTLFRHGLGPFGACLMVRKALATAIPRRATTPVAMTEMVIHALRAGARVAEVQVEKRPRQYGTAMGGKHLRHLHRIGADLARLYFDVNIRGQSLTGWRPPIEEQKD